MPIDGAGLPKSAVLPQAAVLPKAAVPPISPTYYLHSFEQLLATVESRYEDLLNDEEKSPPRPNGRRTRLPLFNRSGDPTARSAMSSARVAVLDLAIAPPRLNSSCEQPVSVW